MISRLWGSWNRMNKAIMVSVSDVLGSMIAVILCSAVVFAPLLVVGAAAKYLFGW